MRDAKGLSPRVVNAISSRVEKSVVKQLEGNSTLPQLSPRGSAQPLSHHERGTISSSVDYFLHHHNGVTESQLQDLGAMLANQILQGRRNKPEKREYEIPSSPRKEAHAARDISTKHEKKAIEAASSIKLPPIASPRNAFVPPPAPSSIAPFATSDTPTHVAEANNRAAKEVLSAALSDQLREKEEERQRNKVQKREECTARQRALELAASAEADVKKARKKLQILHGEEYNHFRKVREIDEKKVLLEKLLGDHLERKDVAAANSMLQQEAHEERRQRRLSEATALDTQLKEKELRKQDDARRNGEAVPEPLCFGASPSDAMQRAMLRRQSLARGLEAQIAASHAHKGRHDHHD